MVQLREPFVSFTLMVTMGQWQQKHIRLSWLLLPVFFVASLLLTLIMANPVFAISESYSWKNSTTITATGGRYGSQVVTFSATKAYSPGKDNIPSFSSGADTGTIYKDPDGCGIDVTLKFTGKNNSVAAVSITIVDFISCTKGDPSPLYDKTATMKNTGKAGGAAEKVSIVVISWTEEGVEYPGSSDTITLRTVATKDVRGTKKVDNDQAHKSDDGKFTGYKTTFNNIASGVVYEACSEQLAICQSGGTLEDFYTGEQSTIIIEKKVDQEAPVTLEETTSCAIDGIGWIVCPVMTFIGRMNDAAFTFLETMLGIRPAVVGSQSVRTAWEAFRDIANIAFVIAFMIIVYSQLTSAGISNYGIKKMLPRIVAAAILVNLSFYVCAIAVDISNIVGSSIYSLLENSIAPEVTSGTNASWEEAISGALAVTLGIGVILVVLLLFIGPMAFLALGLIILILVARQALVILLIVIAPLAFVAYLLPNTENWFKKWWKAFVTTLMVYPIVGLVFGASTLASKVLSSVAADSEDSSLLQIIALGVLAVPLFAVPAILKGALSATGSIGAKIAGLQDRANRATSKSASNRAENFRKDAGNRFKIAAQDPENKWGRRLGGYSRFSNRREAGKRDRENAANRAAELGYATNMIEKDDDGNFTKRAERMQKAAAGGAGVYNEKGQVRAKALATQRTFKQYDDDVAAFTTTQTSDTHVKLLEKAMNDSLSVEERAAAAGSIASRSYREGHLQILEQVHAKMRAADESGDTEQIEALSTIQKQVIGNMKDKPFGLGDQAMGQLVEGNYGRNNVVLNPDGTVKLGADGEPERKVIGDVNEEGRTRTGKKLTAQAVATLNPDDLTRMYNTAGGDPDTGPDPNIKQLTDDELRNLVTKIAEARGNKDTAALIKPEADEKFDKIIKNAAKRGITVDAVSAAVPALVMPGDAGYSRTGGGPTAS